MSQALCMTALLKCDQGLIPSPLVVLPMQRVMTGFFPMANLADGKPFVNIITFGMCQSKANPTVAAMIALTMGAVTVAPCIPVLTGMWIDGGAPKVFVGGMPALKKSGKLMCAYLGQIQAQTPGQSNVKVG